MTYAELSAIIIIMEKLNELICECCGVKPVYGMFVNLGDFDFDPVFVTGSNKKQFIEENMLYTICEDDEDIMRNLERDVYVDFLDPVNFFNLYNLDVGGSVTLAYLLGDLEHKMFDAESFLEYLLFTIQNGSLATSNRIKKSIKKWKWSYDKEYYK